MRKKTIVSAAALVSLVLLLSGCGGGGGPAAGSKVNGGLGALSTEPEAVVRAYCDAIMGDRYGEAGSYWDPAHASSFTMTSNALKDVVSVKATGTGDTRHVEVRVKYTQCESGEVMNGEMDITLRRKDGRWKIISEERDY